MTELENMLAQRVAQVREKMQAALRAAGRGEGDVFLCAACKTQSAQTVRASAQLDIDLFGENRVQELVDKLAAGAYGKKPVHMIGHLQTNKVKYVVGHAALILSLIHILPCTATPSPASFPATAWCFRTAAPAPAMPSAGPKCSAAFWRKRASLFCRTAV